MIHTLYIYLFSHSHKSYGEEKRRRKEEPLAHKRSLSHRPASLVALTARSRKCLPSFKKKSYYDKKKVVPSSVLLKVARTLQSQLVRFHPEVCGWPCASLFRGQRLPLHVSLPLHLPLFSLLLFCPPFTREGEEKQKREKTQEREKRKTANRHTKQKETGKEKTQKTKRLFLPQK